jgi:exodeoxyribonuclease V alpha subunit
MVADDLKGLQTVLEFTAIEREFGRFLCRLAGREAPLLPELGALLLRQINEGHSCLDLKLWRENTLKMLEQEKIRLRILRETGSDGTALRTTLQELSANDLAVRVCSLAREFPQLFAQGLERKTPLIWLDEGNRLYLHRYYACEQDIAQWIRKSLEAEEDLFSPEEIRAAHDYFRNSQDAPDYQQLAVALALKQRFAIITGGPGTGKTTVLAVILGLLLQRHPEYRISLAAPTGKAEARMQEAISSGVSQLHLPKTVTSRLLELQAQTVDSLIGHHPEAVRPWYNREHSLPADFVVIDEASMLSLPAMGMLIDALKPGARLLLLGDRNQLSSVEIGSVFADICNSPVVRNSIATLHKNRRTENNATLIQVAERIVSPGANQSLLADEMYSLQALPGQDGAEFRVSLLPARNQLTAALEELFSAWELDGWSKLSDPVAFFQLANSFKILASNRDGEYGVINLNRLSAQILGIPLYADGTPLMILENDRATGLNNGDIGIVIDRQVFFQNPEKASGSDAPEFLVFGLAALPPHEPVYAMTIHKSQGSGYAKVLMVLPETDNLVLSRELIYTGLTRTELKFQMWANPNILKAALERPTQRISGLTRALQTQHSF